MKQQTRDKIDRERSRKAVAQQKRKRRLQRRRDKKKSVTDRISDL